MAKAKTSDSVSGETPVPSPPAQKFRVTIRNVLCEADITVEASSAVKAAEQVKAALCANVTAEPA